MLLAISRSGWRPGSPSGDRPLPTASAPASTPAAGAPNLTEAVVQRVTDGDTIVLTTGQRVRYIGIDTPEMRRREGDKWVKDPESFAEAATEVNRELTEGKTVRLEFDAQRLDRYGRLLAYVYVDGKMVNEALLERGMAQQMTVPPNVKYADHFREVAREARLAERGLWADREFVEQWWDRR